MMSSTRTRRSTRDQLVIDLLDVWIPATGAGLLDVNEGTLGSLGCVGIFLPLTCTYFDI
jgi:peroxin-11B